MSWQTEHTHLLTHTCCDPRPRGGEWMLNWWKVGRDGEERVGTGQTVPRALLRVAVLPALGPRERAGWDVGSTGEGWGS